MAAAYTFLQRNPKHELTAKYLNYYRGMLDVADESLTDLEAQPYEVGWRGRRRVPPIGLVEEGRCWGCPDFPCHAPSRPCSSGL